MAWRLITGSGMGFLTLCSVTQDGTFTMLATQLELRTMLRQ